MRFSCLLRLIWIASVLAGRVVQAGEPREWTLFDPREGARPEQQGWVFGQLFQTATAGSTGQAVWLDTRAAFPELAGWTRQVPTLLPESAHLLKFELRVAGEEHLSLNRAGFSVLVLNNARRGIELAFWTNGIFAQGDQPLFFQAEWAGLDTTARPVRYELGWQGSRYELRADGVVILSGPLRDYTPFTGILDPYETPNLLFLGDNTSGGRARVELGEIVLRYADGPCPATGSLRWVREGGREWLVWPDDPDRVLEWVSKLDGAATAWTPANLPVSIRDCERVAEVSPALESTFFRLR